MKDNSRATTIAAKNKKKKAIDKIDSEIDTIVSEIDGIDVQIGDVSSDTLEEKKELNKISKKLTGPRSAILEISRNKIFAENYKKIMKDIEAVRKSSRDAVDAVNPIIGKLKFITRRLESDGLVSDPQLPVSVSEGSADVVSAANILSDEIKEQELEGVYMSESRMMEMALFFSVVSKDTAQTIWAIFTDDPTALSGTRLITESLKILIGRMVWGVSYDENKQEADAAINAFGDGTSMQLETEKKNALMKFLLSIVPRPRDVTDEDFKNAKKAIMAANRVGAGFSNLRGRAIKLPVFSVISRIYDNIGVRVPLERFNTTALPPSFRPDNINLPEQAGPQRRRGRGVPEEKSEAEEKSEVGTNYPYDPRRPAGEEKVGVVFEDVDAGEIPEEYREEAVAAGLGIADGIRAAIASGAVLASSGWDIVTKGVGGVVDAIPAMPDIAANIRAANEAAGGGAAGLAARAGAAARAIVGAAGVGGFSAAAGISAAALTAMLVTYIVWKLAPTSGTPPLEEMKGFGRSGTTTEFFKGDERTVDPEYVDTAQVSNPSSWLRPEFNKMGIDVLNDQFAITPLDFENREWSDFNYVSPVDTQNTLEVDNLFNEFLRFSGDLMKPKYMKPTPPPSKSSVNMTMSKFTDQYQLSQAFVDKFDGALTPYDGLSESFNRSVFADDWSNNVLYNANMIVR